MSGTPTQTGLGKYLASRGLMSSDNLGNLFLKVPHHHAKRKVGKERNELIFTNKNNKKKEAVP